MKRLTANLVEAINRRGKYHDGDAGPDDPPER